MRTSERERRDNEPVIEVETLPWTELADSEKLACAALWDRVWPDEDTPGPDARLAAVESRFSPLRGHLVHCAYDTSRELVAVGRTFNHRISIGEDPREIVALASVCSDPDRRGEGFGDAVVTAAFDRVAVEARVSLFQTPVPEYYERFGSIIVNNEIITSIPNAEPFEDPWAMIHPGDADWDDSAVIDLLAPGW